MAFLALVGRPTVAVSVRYVIHSGTAVDTWQEIGFLLAAHIPHAEGVVA